MLAQSGTQTVNKGDLTTPINFPPTGCAYTWTNSAPGIGLPASGSGNIAAFTAQNSGTTPITATIIATPVTTAFCYFPSAQNNVSVFSTATNSIVATIPVGEGPADVCVSPDGSKAYIPNSQSGTVSVISTVSNAVTATIAVGGHPFVNMVSHDGSKLFIGDQFSSTIIEINTADNSVIKNISINGLSSVKLALSPDDNTLYVIYTSPANTTGVLAINVPSGNLISTIAVPGNPSEEVVSADGSKLYIGTVGATGNDRGLAIVNTATRIWTQTVPLPGITHGIALSADGSMLYVTLSAPAEVYVFKTSDLSVVRVTTLSAIGQGAALSVDGSTLYTLSLSNSHYLNVISTATGLIVHQILLKSLSGADSYFVTPVLPCAGTSVSYTITVNAASTVIVASGTPDAVNTVYGTPSASSNFSASGIGLSAAITVTARSGFEISTDNVTFSDILTLAPNAGTVAATTIYIRLTKLAPAGNLADSLVLTSAGADRVAVPVSGMVAVAPVTLKANTVFKIYGTTLSDGSSTAITATGLQNNETIASATLSYGNGKTATDPVGSYPLSVTPSAALGGSFNADNYKITYLLNDIIVKPAQLTIIADNASKPLATPNPTLTVTYAGFVNNENKNHLSSPPTITTTATLNSPIGVYPIVVSGAQADNYIISYMPGSMTIFLLPKNIRIPSAFTPNEDGINDFWAIADLQYYPNCTVEIYDRYGLELYHSIGYAKPWDGKQNNRQLPFGTYYYVITLHDETSSRLAGYVAIVK